MQRGFSLVELLIAATIIALLAGIGVTTYTALSEQSRNSRRQADLENYRSALELYRADNDYYPAALSDLIDPVGSDDYIAKISDDPKAGRDYLYCPEGTNPNYTGYYLYAALEGSQYTTLTPICGSNCGVSCNYQLTPLGAQ